MKRAKTIGLYVVAKATKNKQTTSFQKRLFCSGTKLIWHKIDIYSETGWIEEAFKGR